MKNILLLFFLFFSRFAKAQVNAVLPSEANVFYENAMGSIKPQVKNLITKNANKITGRSVNVDSLVKALHKEPLLKNGNEKDLEAITVLILVQASKNTDDQLKEIVIHSKPAKSINENEKSTAALLVENKSNIAQSVSLIMKKISGSPEMVMDKFK
ncbi:MAG TPA: hypothetical protein VFT78_02625 [Hanamia sp.]|jgi:hypothetical protein|nr:hypothetical protein [Hanamia sp.]HZI68671.1 hypothetical protein [Hanamia sp.]